MRTLRVVEPEVLTQTSSGVDAVEVIVQIDFLVLAAPPQPFDEDIVADPATSVHADAHTSGLQLARELFTCKLRALVRLWLEQLWGEDPRGGSILDLDCCSVLDTLASVPMLFSG